MMGDFQLPPSAATAHHRQKRVRWEKIPSQTSAKTTKIRSFDAPAALCPAASKQGQIAQQRLKHQVASQQRSPNRLPTASSLPAAAPQTPSHLPTASSCPAPQSCGAVDWLEDKRRQLVTWSIQPTTQTRRLASDVQPTVSTRQLLTSNIQPKTPTGPTAHHHPSDEAPNPS
jgi:hypothetical protein